MENSHNLWLPNREHSLDAEYPAITDDELAILWGDYARTSPEQLDTYDDFLGVTKPPEGMPSVVVSVDLCEVVRMTHASIRTVEEPFGTPFTPEPYGSGTHSLRTKRDVVSVAQVMINSGNIQPVPEIHHIARHLWLWRKMGAYIVANTSTSEGCEPGTVQYLAEHTPGGFDGILFPRNHDGTGTVTKGNALRAVIDRYIHPDQPLHVLHIDDTSHHLENMPKAFSDRDNTVVKTFQPLYESVQPHPESVHGTTPLETFQLAHHTIIRALANGSSELSSND